jgi:adenosine deaminase
MPDETFDLDAYLAGLPKAELHLHIEGSLEDAALTARLVAQEMTLTVCPLSNLKLCVVNDMSQHPLKRMLDLGLKATVNSDDPAYFGGYLNANFRAVAQGVGLGRGDLVTLARNSFTGSFLDEEQVALRLAEVEAYDATFSG